MKYLSLVLFVLAALLTACPEEPVTVSCSRHQDCEPGNLCERSVCVTGTPCRNDGECSGDQRCINAACVVSPRHDGGVVTVDAATPDGSGDAGGADAQQASCFLTLDPDPVEFGAVRVGAQVLRSVEIRNDSESEIEVLQVSIVNNSTSSEFAIDGSSSFGSGRIAPGQSQSVSLVYTPVDALPDAARLQLVTTGCPDQTLFGADLLAEFKQSPSIAVTTAASTTTPHATTLDFGDVRLGQFAQRSVFVKNTQAESGLMVESASLQPSSGTPFIVMTDQALPATLSQWLAFCTDASACDAASNQRCADGACQSATGPWVDQLRVTVQFEPSALGSSNVQLHVVSTDSASSPFVITILGNGIPAHDCPARSHAPGSWDAAASRCVWSCADGWFDLNGDLALTTGSDGCEYECSLLSGVYDEPDMSFVDANCDGMDGVIEDGWFVAASAASCSGQNCGSMAQPFNDLRAGIGAAASHASKKRVYVSNEVYALSSTLLLPEGVRVYGGYVVLGVSTDLQWRSRSGQTTIQGASPAVDVRDAVSETLLHNLKIHAADGTLTEPSSIVLRAVSAPGLHLVGVDLQAGAGLDGQDGARGTDGTDGENGSPGKPGCEWGTGWANCREGGRAGLAVSNGGRGGGGGNGGFHSWEPNNLSVIASGNDGVINESNSYFSSGSGPFTDDYEGYLIVISAALNENNNGRFTITTQVDSNTVQLGNAQGLLDETGLAWQLVLQRGAMSGEPNSGGISGGAAGDRVGGSIPNLCYGADGFDGQGGRHGNPGLSGSAVASGLSGERWVLGNGSSGGGGAEDATGGSGGGGGAGADCEKLCLAYIEPWHVCLFKLDDRCNTAPLCGSTGWGGGGGGGGSAGSPGTGGSGGTAGAASIGVLSIHSPLQIESGSITTGVGGLGGNGGDGGIGGLGGDGRLGGSGTAPSGMGGAGGNGGHGAYGGGGAGGAGGDVYGIVYKGAEPQRSGGFSITLGAPGAGGASGRGAEPGFCNRSDPSDCGHGQDGVAGEAVEIKGL